MARKRSTEVVREVAGGLAAGLIIVALGVAWFAIFEKDTPIDAYADTVVTMLLGALALIATLAATGD